MIEFKTKRAGKGKRSRVYKKFPRKKIAKSGEKVVGWHKNNWYDDNYPYFDKKVLHKFLLSNIGRPVDKVYSEFLNRCRKSTKMYNLKHEFYKIFEEKEDIHYWGGFYLTNGIINYKKRRKYPYKKHPISILDLNRELIPKDFRERCKECERKHRKQYLGKFWIDYKTLQDVYIIEREIWDDINMFGGTQDYKRVHLHGVGSSIYKEYWVTQSKLPKVTYRIVDAYIQIDKADIIFITKIN